MERGAVGLVRRAARCSSSSFPGCSSASGRGSTAGFSPAGLRAPPDASWSRIARSRWRGSPGRLGRGDRARRRARRLHAGRRVGFLPPHARHGADAGAGGVEPAAVSDSGTAGRTGAGEVRWTPEAEARVARAPMFLRGMVRRLAEKRARAEGIRVITPELMTRYKSEMMGLAASGGVQGAAAGRAVDPRGAGAPRRRPAVHAADDAPDLRGAGGRARGGGGDAGPHPGGRGGGRDRGGGGAAPVDAGGRRRGSSRGSGRPPAMMADFVLRLFQRDVEVEARRGPATRKSPPRWSSGSGRRRRRRRSAGRPEAWARLQTAPEFVREGIRKAAERRARRMGVAGDHLARSSRGSGTRP